MSALLDFAVYSRIGSIDDAAGDSNMALAANLDAMIKREDLDVTDAEPAQVKIASDLKLAELEQASVTYNILRKPDFQRETANWEPEKIADLIASFLDGDLIPSVIVWRSNKSGKLFVIDGAHRLSALISWVNDDYGDQGLSRALFGGEIEPLQKKIAKKTRDLIDAKIGRYERLKRYVIKPEEAPDEQTLLRARNMGSFSIALEDVKGDVAKAERSFLKINQNAVPISPTELIIIRSRRKPNAIATRALIRAGSGHAYWSGFEPDNLKKVVEISRAVYENLFRPVLEYPIRTLDLPAAGRSLTADSLDLVFSLVNYVNHVTNVAKKKNEVEWKIYVGTKPGADLADDDTGPLTVQFLECVRDATSNVFGKTEPGSLALHPGVYCYSATGRFQPTAFLAAIALVERFAVRKRFAKFTNVRAKFEDFLINHRHFINQIASEYGSQLKGLPALHKLYELVIDRMINGDHDWASLIDHIREDEELRFIRDITEEDRKYGRNFSRETSNAVYLREALAKELTCSICGARINGGSITLDHKTRKEDGGMGAPHNGALAHPYCNTGYKEAMVHAERVGA